MGARIRRKSSPRMIVSCGSCDLAASIARAIQSGLLPPTSAMPRALSSSAWNRSYCVNAACPVGTAEAIGPRPSYRASAACAPTLRKCVFIDCRADRAERLGIEQALGLVDKALRPLSVSLGIEAHALGFLLLLLGHALDLLLALRQQFTPGRLMLQIDLRLGLGPPLALHRMGDARLALKRRDGALCAVKPVTAPISVTRQLGSEVSTHHAKPGRKRANFSRQRVLV